MWAKRSRLMASDEAGTHKRLKSLRANLFNPKASAYGGHTVKLMGDGTLMESASVVDAVDFAIELQQAVQEHEPDVPDQLCIVYRIGINVGDVIVESDDIYGDGVNVAARLYQPLKSFGRRCGAEF